MLDRIRHWFSDTPEGVPLNLGMGMLGLVLGLVQERPQLVLLGLCYAGAFLLVGFRARWARYALMVLFLFMGARLIANAFWFGPTLIRLVGTGFCLWMALDVWRRYAPEKLGSRLEKSCALVLLLTQPRALAGEDLARLLEKKWGGSFAFDATEDSTHEDVEEGDEQRQLVVDQDGYFMVYAHRGWFLFHNVDEPYWSDDAEVVATMHEDLRCASIVREHCAWLSIDLLRVGQSDDEQALQMRAMGKLIAALADEDTIGLYRPDDGLLNVWGPEAKDHLERGQLDAALFELSEPPVLSIECDDEALLSGVAEAKQRWPEFVQRFVSHDAENDSFAVKAPVTREEVTEFIWIDVDKLEAGRLRGTLQNAPVNLGDLNLGDQVEVLESDVYDWVYVVGLDDPVGMFTLAAFQPTDERS